MRINSRYRWRECVRWCYRNTYSKWNLLLIIFWIVLLKWKWAGIRVVRRFGVTWARLKRRLNRWWIGRRRIRILGTRRCIWKTQILCIKCSCTSRWTRHSGRTDKKWRKQKRWCKSWTKVDPTLTKWSKNKKDTPQSTPSPIPRKSATIWRSWNRKTWIWV